MNVNSRHNQTETGYQVIEILWSIQIQLMRADFGAIITGTANLFEHASQVRAMQLAVLTLN